MPQEKLKLLLCKIVKKLEGQRINPPLCLFLEIEVQMEMFLRETISNS